MGSFLMIYLRMLLTCFVLIKLIVKLCPLCLFHAVVLDSSGIYLLIIVARCSVPFLILYTRAHTHIYTHTIIFLFFFYDDDSSLHFIYGEVL